jgi:SNF2 family DNA or RNA helicase
VVCPASVKRNWRADGIAAPGASTLVIGQPEKGAPAPEKPDWVVVNYDILSKHVGTLGAERWAGLVFDEAHYLKNHRSARSRLARQLADRAKSRAVTRRPCTSDGTPLTNRPRDLFVLLQLVNHPLGRSLSFAKRYCAAERNEYGWQTRGASNIEELTVQLHG